MFNPLSSDKFRPSMEAKRPAKLVLGIAKRKWGGAKHDLEVGTLIFEA